MAHFPSCLRGSLKGSVVGDGVFPKGACDAGVPGTFVANELEFFLFKSEPGIDGTGLDKMPFGVVAVSLTGRVAIVERFDVGWRGGIRGAWGLVASSLGWVEKTW